MDLLEIISWLWNNGLVIPMTNLLVLLSRLSFGNFGIGIIMFTLITRALTWPLTLSQMKATKVMQVVQPKVQEIQKKYKDPKRRSEETMKLYRAEGANPLGCVGPMLIQLPIMIALFQSIRFTLGSTPEQLVELSQRLYPWAYLDGAVPLESQFLGLNLGENAGGAGPIGLFLAVSVGASMWLQQRLMSPKKSTDSQQQQMQSMMLWMMPLMFGWWTLSFPAGMGVYWVATNVVSIVLQYFYIGPKEVSWKRIFGLAPQQPAPAGKEQPQAALKPADDAEEEATGDTDQSEEVAARDNVNERPRRRRRRGRRRRR